jgi:hypothetical protein
MRCTVSACSSLAEAEIHACTNNGDFVVAVVVDQEVIDGFAAGDLGIRFETGNVDLTVSCCHVDVVRLVGAIDRDDIGLAVSPGTVRAGEVDVDVTDRCTF